MKIILVMVSALRMDHVGVYGNRWLKMENFDKLGKMGRVFTEARGNGIDAVNTRIEILSGLDSRRWVNANEGYRQMRKESLLPGLFIEKGYATALFTDNYPQLELYESVNGFQTVHFVPGQGDDRHVPGIFPKTTNDLEEAGFNEIVSGGREYTGEQNLTAFVRNRSLYPQMGHPTDRLFDAARNFINCDEKDWFVVIDSFGLCPPWDAPKEFSRFRNVEDLTTLAWPVAGPVDGSDREIQKKLNTLRRAYADQCLFVDSQIGKICGEGITVIVMSDHGVFIGDEDFILGLPGQTSEILTRQVLMTSGPGIEKGSRCDQGVRNVDFFATFAEKLSLESFPGVDGKVIPGLLGS